MRFCLIFHLSIECLCYTVIYLCNDRATVLLCLKTDYLFEPFQSPLQSEPNILPKTILEYMKLVA